jgi:hypothetical protein
MAANEPYIAHIVPIELALRSADQADGPDLNAPSLDAPIQAMLCGTMERMARAEARLLEHPGVSASGHPSGRSGRTMNSAMSPPIAALPKNPDGARREPGAPLFAAPSQRLGRFPSGSHSTESLPILTLHRTEYPSRDLSILDILPPGCSKGAAILSLAATQGVNASQILAIGDNWNDLSMLEIAGAAVLMDNAPVDLKALARARGWRIGLSNTADGVAEAIEATLSVACE